jgi:hypothetical protein
VAGEDGERKCEALSEGRRLRWGSQYRPQVIQSASKMQAGKNGSCEHECSLLLVTS